MIVQNLIGYILSQSNPMTYQFLKSLNQQWKTQTKKFIKSLQTDNQCGFTCFNAFIQENGITHCRSYPNTHTQMGTVESQQCHIVNMGLTLLNLAKLPLKLRNYAFSIVAFIYNRTTIMILGDQSPYQLLYQESPNLLDLQVF